MASFFDKTYQTIKSIAKIAIQSRRPTVKTVPGADRIVIMGNGPSLNETIEKHMQLLEQSPCMAVNFAANSPVFERIKPAYYVIADPHFFQADGDANVDRLWQRLGATSWQMTLYVPARYCKTALRRLCSDNVKVERFNAIGAEGFRAPAHTAYRLGLAMPRPRNVLIPAIMLAIAAGFRQIIVTGADHSWMKTISVTDNNEVVSIQPHFYADDARETERIQHAYKGYTLHSIVESFAVAFRSYHQIAAYAKSRGADIVNATPGSYIDAFRRAKAEELI